MVHQHSEPVRSRFSLPDSSQDENSPSARYLADHEVAEHPKTGRRSVRLALVGRPEDPAFRNLGTFLKRSETNVISQFLTLQDLWDSGFPGDSATQGHSAFDLIVVLQSTSDQFAVTEIHRLIGAMLFGRVLCCYGPWCMSDGRSHDLWPVALRVAVDSAIPVLASELLAFRLDQLPASPMSAAEEVLSFRIESIEQLRQAAWPDSANAILPLSHRDAVVVCPDTVFRSTLTGLLREYGLRVVSVADTEAADVRLKQKGFRGIALIDLDSIDVPAIQQLVKSCRKGKDIVFTGLTAFAPQSVDLPVLDHIFEKTELYWQLPQLGSSKVFGS